MTINITPEIMAAYEAYLDEEVDADMLGNPIRRRNTYPTFGLVDFAAGFQAGRATSVFMLSRFNASYDKRKAPTGEWLFAPGTAK